MLKDSTLARTLSVVAFSLGCALGPLPARAQSQPARERPRLKGFGDSLERLKWDERRRTAVEEKRPKKSKEQRRGAGGGEEEEVVRVETSLVVCDVLVLDARGQAVTGLTREDFLIKEDGQAQEVGTFALGDSLNVPRTVVLVIDYSSSQFPYIKMSVAAAKALIDRLGPRDLMAVVTDDVELLSDFTADKEELKRKLDTLVERVAGGIDLRSPRFDRSRRFGRSAQFRALFATLREAFDEEDVRPIVIFQTDGDELGLLRDPVVQPFVPPWLPPDMQKEAEKAAEQARKRLDGSRREFSLGDIGAAAEKARATIYTVVPGYRAVGLTFEEQLRRNEVHRRRFESAWGFPAWVIRKQMDARDRRTARETIKAGLEQEQKVQQALIDLSALTGGWAEFLEEPGQAAAIYERIFADVSRRYVLGFYPTNRARDGGRRRVSVEVRGHPEYTVWGRKSYYAPGPEE